MDAFRPQSRPDSHAMRALLKEHHVVSHTASHAAPFVHMHATTLTASGAAWLRPTPWTGRRDSASVEDALLIKLKGEKNLP